MRRVRPRAERAQVTVAQDFWHPNLAGEQVLSIGAQARRPCAAKDLGGLGRPGCSMIYELFMRSRIPDAAGRVYALGIRGP